MSAATLLQTITPVPDQESRGSNSVATLAVDLSVTTHAVTRVQRELAQIGLQARIIAARQFSLEDGHRSLSTTTADYAAAIATLETTVVEVVDQLGDLHARLDALEGRVSTVPKERP